MTRSFLTRLIAVVTASLLLVSGCGSQPHAGAGDGGDLVIARAQDASTMLPSTTTQNADVWTLQQIYETLTLNKPDGTGVVPGLATSWQQSSNRLSWTFHLRQGVRFHSGKPLTADDVVFSLNYVRNTKDKTNLWASNFTPIKSVQKVDDATVRIDLNQPWTPLPSYLALFAASIYPKNFGGRTITYMQNHEDGTGPFELASWAKGQSLKLVRNTHYWRKGVPKLHSATFNVVADDNTRMLQLQGGQADIDEGPAPTSMNMLGRSRDIRAVQFPSTQVNIFNLNNKAAGLDDPKVRRAMSYALDRQAIVKVVYAGFGQPANSFISPGLGGHDAKVDGATYSMAQARRLMRESKHPTGLNITIQTMSGSQEDEMVAQVAQQSWGDLGIKVTIQKVDSATMVTNRAQGKFDVQASYTTSDVTDTSEMISFMAVTDGSGIQSGYGNPKVNSWAQQSVSEPDENKRNQLFGRAQQQVADDAPIIPICYQGALYGVSTKVHGFRPYVLGTYGLAATSLGE